MGALVPCKNEMCEKTPGAYGAVAWTIKVEHVSQHFVILIREQEEEEKRRARHASSFTW